MYCREWWLIVLLEVAQGEEKIILGKKTNTIWDVIEKIQTHKKLDLEANVSAKQRFYQDFVFFSILIPAPMNCLR